MARRLEKAENDYKEILKDHESKRREQEDRIRKVEEEKFEFRGIFSP